MNVDEKDARPHLLQDPWPEFLDLLDTDRARAFEAFYLFARRLLLAAPPRILLDVSVDSREDLIHDIILHCCRNEFRILRQYRDHGKPFAAWFRFVAHNKTLDRLRTRKGQDDLQAVSTDTAEERVAGTAPSPAREVSGRDLLAKVRVRIDALGDVCRILLLGAAEGRPPRDMVQLLGWPDDWNKKASDTLRDCRGRLRRRLEADGLDVKEFVT